MWQDYAIGAVEIVFLASLYPSLKQRQFPARLTCWITTLGLLVIAGTVASLGAWRGACLSTLTGLVWLYMALAARAK